MSHRGKSTDRPLIGPYRRRPEPGAVRSLAGLGSPGSTPRLTAVEALTE